jgi:hypothetical protein
MSECKVPGCGMATSGYSTFCANHKRRQQGRWEALVDIAKAEMLRYQGGTPMSRYEVEAWSNVEKIGAAARGTEVIETVLSMYLMQEEMPHRFRSDAAFGGQLVRRVRTLAPSNAGEYFDHKSGKSKKVYRDAKPKTVAILAGLLRDTFGAAGLIVARLEQREIGKKNEEMRELDAALEELQ